MAELWRQLIDSADAALSSLISLGRVEISRSKGDMTIYLNSSRILTRREFKKISKAFTGAFPMVKVNVVMQYPELKESVEKDIKLATSLLSELVSHESPASMPFLEWNSSEWKLENGLVYMAARLFI